MTLKERAARRTSSPAADAEAGIGTLGRIGLGGRTAFYAILMALTVRIALLGGGGGHQADANGALTLVSRPLLGKVAIAGVALGFVLFGVGRLIGAATDGRTSVVRRLMTALQGLFYLALAYVPASFLSGNRQTGSQQQQQKTTAELLNLPAGRWLVAALGALVIVVCAVQIGGAWNRNFRDGLKLTRAPRWVKRIVDVAGEIGITARALVFLPVGGFLILAAVRSDPGHSLGTDGELLRLAGHPWGIAVLAAIAAGMGIFVVFSAIETRYRQVISAK